MSGAGEGNVLSCTINMARNYNIHSSTVREATERNVQSFTMLE